MHMEILAVGPYEANCVVFWNDPAQAWIVDPGANPEEIRGLLRRHSLHVARYVCTHGHIDHLSALNDLLATDPAPVCLHAADAKWSFSTVNCLPPFYPVAPRRLASVQTDLTDGGTLAADGIEIRTIFTPGHTPGGICLHLPREKLLLSGDTLFAGSVGRTDFPGGNMRLLQQSLQKLMELPDDTRVVPGHGPLTIIGLERRENPYLQQGG